jgi:hypothetical protein
MWRVRSGLGWRHPVRKVRRKAVRGVYRGLMPRKRRRRRKTWSAPRTRAANRKVEPTTPASPASVGCVILSVSGCFAGVMISAASGNAAAGWWIAGVGVGLGVLALFVLPKTPKAQP